MAVAGARRFLPLAVGVAPSPFTQSDWPNPGRYWTKQAYFGSTSSLPLNLYGKDQFFAAPGMGPDYDYPNPRIAGRLNPGFTASVLPLLLGQDVFFAAPGEAQARTYPNPLVRRVQQPEVPANVLALSTPVVVATPFSQDDWPVPVRTKAAQQPTHAPRQLPATAAAPFIAQDWTNPLRYAPPRTGSTQDGGQRLLVGKDQFFYAPGQAPRYDYPNPLIRRVQQPQLAGPSLATYSTPFVNAFTNPQVQRFSPQFQPTRSIALDVVQAVPVRPYDWSLPARRGPAQPAQLDQRTIQLAALGATPPFAQMSWPNPRRAANQNHALGSSLGPLVDGATSTPNTGWLPIIRRRRYA